MKINLLLILVLGLVLRFGYLGSLPPSTEALLSGRFISAVSGFLSILLIYLFCRRYFNNKTLALFSALSFTLLPLAIVENRINSWVSVLNLGVIIFFLLLTFKNRWLNITGLVIFIIVVYFYRNNLWFFNNTLSVKPGNFFNNIFNLISFNKIFFSNDTYWAGGLRNYGMLYPESIILFLLGIYQFLRERKKLSIIIFSLIIIVIASASPTYPEAREAGLLMFPLSLIVGIGIQYFCEWFRKGKKPFFVIILTGIYSLILLYGIINFFHYYIIHYKLRVQQENLFINKNF